MGCRRLGSHTPPHPHPTHPTPPTLAPAPCLSSNRVPAEGCPISFSPATCSRAAAAAWSSASPRTLGCTAPPSQCDPPAACTVWDSGPLGIHKLTPGLRGLLELSVADEKVPSRTAAKWCAALRCAAARRQQPEAGGHPGGAHPAHHPHPDALDHPDHPQGPQGARGCCGAWGGWGGWGS